MTKELMSRKSTQVAAKKRKIKVDEPKYRALSVAGDSRMAADEDEDEASQN